MSIELFWGSGSMPSRRVMLALAHKGIPYESRLISFSNRENRTPEFLAMNPSGKVPTVRDGDFALSESLAIVAWIERRHPDPPLFGRTPEECGLIWRECLDHENTFDPIYRSSIRPISYGQAEQKADEIRAGLPALHAQLRSLESRVASGFLIGRELTAADLVWYSAMAMVVRTVTRPAAEPFDLGIYPFSEHYPGLLPWARRVEAIPGFDDTVPPHWLEGDHPAPRRFS